MKNQQQILQLLETYTQTMCTDVADCQQYRQQQTQQFFKQLKQLTS